MLNEPHNVIDFIWLCDLCFSSSCIVNVIRRLDLKPLEQFYQWVKLRGRAFDCRIVSSVAVWIGLWMWSYLAYIMTLILSWWPDTVGLHRSWLTSLVLSSAVSFCCHPALSSGDRSWRDLQGLLSCSFPHCFLPRAECLLDAQCFVICWFVISREVWVHDKL